MKTPSSLPDDAPDRLCLLREIALDAIDEVSVWERQVKQARRKADDALTRYENALLEHRGQLNLLDEP